MLRRHGTRFEAWSRSAPSPILTLLSENQAARSPTGSGSAGITPPCTTTSRLTPRRASVCLSRTVIASPTRSPSIRRPGHTWTTGHLLDRHGVGSGSCTGPYEVSQDHFVNKCRHGPPKPPSGAPSPPSRSLHGERSSASLFVGKSPRPAGLASVHCTFEPVASPPLPSDPSSPRRPEHQLLNFNDQSSGRTFTSLLAKLPVVPRQGPRRSGGPVLSAAMPLEPEET